VYDHSAGRFAEAYNISTGHGLRIFHVRLWVSRLFPSNSTFTVFELDNSFVYSGQETVLVVHLARVYGLDAYRAGLAFIAAVIPTLVSLPLTGYFADNYGAEWVAFLSLVLGIPWWGIITLKFRLPKFLAIFAMESEVSPTRGSFLKLIAGLYSQHFSHRVSCRLS
jgi:hypothetical protein